MICQAGLVAADVPGKHKVSFPLKHMKCKTKSTEVWLKAQVWDQALLTSEQIQFGDCVLPREKVVSFTSTWCTLNIIFWKMPASFRNSYFYDPQHLQHKWTHRLACTHSERVQLAYIVLSHPRCSLHRTSYWWNLYLLCLSAFLCWKKRH